MSLRKAAEMALYALEEFCANKCEQEISALRAALTEADEPDETGLYHNRIHEEMPNARPAHAVRHEPGISSTQVETASTMCPTVEVYDPRPPRREPLTRKQLTEIIERAREMGETDGSGWHVLPYSFARAVERAHGIGGES